MKLIKNPETQLEYWEVIEELGTLIVCFIFNLPDLNLANDFIEKDDDINIYEISFIINQMLNEIGEKFGITRPYGDTKPDILPNQIYYWDWYGNLKKEFYEKIAKNS